VKSPKIAIIHDYLNAYGGQEAVTSAIWELWPNAPIYTALWDPAVFKKTRTLQGAKIVVPKWATSKFVNRFYKYFTFLYPIVFERLDLSKFDIVISSSANFAKGVITKPTQLHISYIHTPPRFLYGYPTESSKRDNLLWKPILKIVDYFLLRWDQKAAQRPDFLLCNSKEVRDRIKRLYKRDAKIIYPFINIQNAKGDKAAPTTQAELARRCGRGNLEDGENTGEKEEYYLTVTRMSLYKHVDKAILACARLGRKLKVAGSGKEFERFKKIAESCGGDIEMLGFVSENQKADLYKNCRALIHPVEFEDFGMTPLEAMYLGKPAIVPNQGGFKDTVIDGYNGVFSKSSSVTDLSEAILRFEELEKRVNWEKNCKETASRFTKERFKKEFKGFVEKSWENFEMSVQNA